MAVEVSSNASSSSSVGETTVVVVTSPDYEVMKEVNDETVIELLTCRLDRELARCLLTSNLVLSKAMQSAPFFRASYPTNSHFTVQ